MAFKVNYGLERAERNRAKQAKKDAKVRERKAARDDQAPETPETGDEPAAPESGEPV